MKEVRVVVFVDGGRVDQVISDFPVEVVIVDCDIEDLDDDEDIFEVLNQPSYVYAGIESADVSPGDVQQVFEDVGRQIGSPEAVAPSSICPECSQRRLATKEEISRARAMYQSTDLEIDNDARVSDADDHLWVQAWVYLRRDTDGAGE